MTTFVDNPNLQIEDDRTGLSVDTLRRALADNLFYIQGKWPEAATRNDFYMALAYTVRDRLLQRWLNSLRNYLRPEVRIVSYLSAEFLLGPHLGNNLISLGIEDQVRQAVEQSGLDLNDLIAQEEEPGLGNGGLGRLAACYMDSLSTLEIPAIGYGIRYEFGIFEQRIRDGWQVEVTDKWLQHGNPWEIARPEAAVMVGFGGHTEGYTNSDGRYRVRWIPHQVIKGIPYDTAILGYRVNTANTLRLWTAEAVESFDFQAFNGGNYYGAVDQKITSENISKVLYPNDEQAQGKQLRLEQQYFFVSCALQDMIRIHRDSGRPLTAFHEKFAVQLNDTHPAIGVAELMRLLVDEHALEWPEAWEITQRTFAYTNHTLLPEALEKWPLDLFKRVLPRHLEIILEINQRFLDKIRIQYFNDPGKLSRLSLAGAQQPWPQPVDHRSHRRSLDSPPRRPAAARRPPGGQQLSPGLAAGEARSQAKPDPDGAGQARPHPQPRLPVRYPGQANPRVQAAAPQRAAHHHPLRSAAAKPQSGDRPPHLYLWRQSGPRLRHGQANHQTDQRRSRGDQQ
jgi:glycogen phosphorylase